MGKLKVEKILNGLLYELCYFVHEEDKNVGFCIDPGYDVRKILSFLDKNDYIVDSILLTHGHFDHSIGCEEIVKKYNSKIYCTKEEVDLIFDPEKNYSYQIKKHEPMDIEIYKTLEDNEVIEICGQKIKCITTPGHTKGGVCYYIDDAKILFSGDTLFYKTFGRTDFYGGSIAEIFDSIKNKLFKLDDSVTVYPGHGDMTSIGFEKENNVVMEGDYEL